MTLDELLDDYFRPVMHLPDPTGPLAVLAAAAVNLYSPGRPVWLMLVGPPASGKTLAIRALERVPAVHATSTLTRASLLTIGKNRQLGGLLADVSSQVETSPDGSTITARGGRSVLVVDDFTAQLSTGDALDLVRELFDGKVSRRLGSHGGVLLRWEGQLGIIAGVTDMIEDHRAELGTKGERFCYVALPEVDACGRDTIARQAVAASVDATRIEALADGVAHFLANLPPVDKPQKITEADTDRLVAAADLACLARSPVVRDRYSGDVELIPAAEVPGRLAGEFAQLLRGLGMIGAAEPAMWRVMQAAVLGCIPSIRRRVLRVLLDDESGLRTAQVAVRLRIPTRTVRRTLDDLAVHGVLDVDGDMNDERGSLWWSTSPATRRQWAAIIGGTPSLSNGAAGREQDAQVEQRAAPRTPTAPREQSLALWQAVPPAGALRFLLHETGSCRGCGQSARSVDSNGFVHPSCLTDGASA